MSLLTPEQQKEQQDQINLTTLAVKIAAARKPKMRTDANNPTTGTEDLTQKPIAVVPPSTDLTLQSD